MTIVMILIGIIGVASQAAGHNWQAMMWAFGYTVLAITIHRYETNER